VLYLVLISRLTVAMQPETEKKAKTEPGSTWDTEVAEGGKETLKAKAACGSYFNLQPSDEVSQFNV